MKRILNLGLAIASFAFILCLAGCGPVANTNTGANSPAKPTTPTPTATPVVLDAACREIHPDAGHIRQAIVERIANDPILSSHYHDGDQDHSSIKFTIKPDNDGGFKMKLQGNLGYQAFVELPNVMQYFAADTCVRRVFFVLKGSTLLEDESVDAKSFLDAFEWDLTCQDPNHPCSDGSCIPAGQACSKHDPRGNVNTNTNANTNKNINK